MNALHRGFVSKLNAKNDRHVNEDLIESIYVESF